MTTRFLVDGVSLDRSGVWEVAGETQPHVSADQVAAQLLLPSRSGARVRRLAWGLGSQGLVLNVFGPGVEERAAQLRGLLGRARVLTVESGAVSRSVDVVSVSVSEPQLFGDVMLKLAVTFTLQPFWVEGAGVLPSGDRFFRVASGVPTAPRGALYEVTLSGGVASFDDRLPVGLG